MPGELKTALLCNSPPLRSGLYKQGCRLGDIEEVLTPPFPVEGSSVKIGYILTTLAPYHLPTNSHYELASSLRLVLKRGNQAVKIEICHSLFQLGLLCSIYILLQGTIKLKQFGPHLQVTVALSMTKWRMSHISAGHKMSGIMKFRTWPLLFPSKVLNCSH